MSRNINQDNAVEIGVELQDVLPDPTDAQILDALEDCIGRPPSETEGALVLIAYNHGEKTAKASHWYRW